MSARLLSLAVLLAALVSAPAFAQGPSQDDLKKKRDEKLAGDWVKKFPWITDYTKAKEEAKKSGKLIFAYFSRSYAP